MPETLSLAPEEIAELKGRLTGDTVRCEIVVTEANADACITVSVMLPPDLDPDVTESIKTAAANAARMIAEELGAS
jgi:hypothetical protein